jgi:hypothetical protein
MHDNSNRQASVLRIIASGGRARASRSFCPVTKLLRTLTAAPARPIATMNSSGARCVPTSDTRAIIKQPAAR